MTIRFFNECPEGKEADYFKLVFKKEGAPTDGTEKPKVLHIVRYVPVTDEEIAKKGQSQTVVVKQFLEHEGMPSDDEEWELLCPECEADPCWAVECYAQMNTCFYKLSLESSNEDMIYRSVELNMKHKINKWIAEGKMKEACPMCAAETIKKVFPSFFD